MPPAQHNIIAGSPPKGETSSTPSTPVNPPNMQEGSLFPKVPPAQLPEPAHLPELAPEPAQEQRMAQEVPVEEHHGDEQVNQPLYVDTGYSSDVPQPQVMSGMYYGGGSQPIPIPAGTYPMNPMHQPHFSYMYSPPQAGSPVMFQASSPSLLGSSVSSTCSTPVHFDMNQQQQQPPQMEAGQFPPQPPQHWVYSAPQEMQQQQVMSYPTPPPPAPVAVNQTTPPPPPMMAFPAQGCPPVPQQQQAYSSPPNPPPGMGVFPQQAVPGAQMVIMQQTVQPPFSPAFNNVSPTSSAGSFSPANGYLARVSPVSMADSTMTALERLRLGGQAPMYKPPAAHNLRQPMDMAQVWHESFTSTFSRFLPHQWSLKPVPEGIEKSGELHIFEDTAKIRFVCEKCRHAWTSMQGKVKFWFVLDKLASTGTVFFKLFGQLCKDCVQNTGSKDIQPALWYPDEIQKVVHNVHAKVGMIYYNLKEPMLQIQRRIGKPKGQHNAELCQACIAGICRRGMPNPLYS